jgi:predicted nucleic-acid-binding Zn-ribbon protein
MKTTEKCPKCDSDEIYAQLIYTSEMCDPYLEPILGSFYGPGQLIISTCGNCGYCEFYVPKDLLGEVKKKFRRVV